MSVPNPGGAQTVNQAGGSDTTLIYGECAGVHVETESECRVNSRRTQECNGSTSAKHPGLSRGYRRKRGRLRAAPRK